MIAALVIELRRSPLRLWLPLLIAVDLAVLWLRPHTWVGVWPEASAAAQLPTLYLGLALGAGAAWNAGRIARSDVDELLLQMPRPVWQRELLTFVGSWTYGVIAYVAGVAAVALASMSTPAPGFLWPSYLLLGLAMITQCTAVGHLAGRLLRSRFAAPLVAFSVVFLNVAVRDGQDHLFYVLSGAVQLHVSAVAVAARVFVAAALAALAVTVIPLAERKEAGRRPVRYVPSAVTAIVVVAAIGLVATAGPLRRERVPPSHPTCTNGIPRVCLWPDDAKYLQTTTAMASRFSSLPTDLMTVPTTFYEAGLRPQTAGPTDFSTLFGTWSIAQNMTFTVTGTVVDAANCTVKQSDQEKYFAAAFSLDQWLSERVFGGPQPADIHGGPPGLDREAIHAVEQQPLDQQFSWARERVTTMRSLCG